MKLKSGRIVADTIFHSGRVITVDQANSMASAIAICDGRVMAVGKDPAIMRMAGPATRTVDLHGQTVIPGLIDNHTHQMMAGLDTAAAGVKVNLASSPSIEQIKAKIADQVRHTAPGEWITTSCMFRGALAEGRYPDRHDLDAVAPNNPVYIADGGRNIIVNTLALELAGIDANTPDPGAEPDISEGQIVRDADGIPTGHLLAGAGDLARKAWWERLGQPIKMWDFLDYDPEIKRRALRAQMAEFNEAGITGARDMGVSTDDIDTYMDLARRGEMTVRTNLILGIPVQYYSIQQIMDTLHSYIGPKQGFGDEWLRIGGLKIVAQSYGYWTMHPEKIRALISEGNRLGWSFAIHGTPGDLGNDIEVILDALDDADRESPIAGRLWSYEHAFGLIDAKYIERFRRLGMVIAANPHLSYVGAGRSVEMQLALDSVRMADAPTDSPMQIAARKWGQPFKTWLQAGLLVTGGSDCPAVPYEKDRPLLGLWTTFSQATLAGTLMPEERIDRATALRIWTINNAIATGEAEIKGSLEPGKLADLVVLSGDPLSIPEEEFLSLRVQETMVGGRPVYQRT